MSKMIHNVTADTLAKATGLDRNDARTVLDAFVVTSKATITGKRRTFDERDGKLVAKVGRQSNVFSVDADALAALFTTAEKIREASDEAADMAATAQARYDAQPKATPKTLSEAATSSTEATDQAA